MEKGSTALGQALCSGWALNTGRVYIYGQGEVEGGLFQKMGWNEQVPGVGKHSVVGEY